MRGTFFEQDEADSKGASPWKVSFFFSLFISVSINSNNKLFNAFL